ncbi:hypothetical protein NPIL_335941 [Nephila pilipes]|uniref:Uncharacterized protein n=1 Tax=Nephila pilipes TaxID=299642 RepID=A0A8X6U1S5_NEPPI|nr:hypothetical protein NPIL_335941 [Nephila pilipes]
MAFYFLATDQLPLKLRATSKGYVAFIDTKKTEYAPHDFIFQGLFKEKRPPRPCILNRSAVRASRCILCRRYQRKAVAGQSPSLFRALWN